MLVNFTLIPFLLKIFMNVSEYSNFDPEYLYTLNQTETEYGEFINSTELTSTIMCQPLLTDQLRCYLYDVMVVNSKYTNFNDRITSTNLIKVGYWFHMQFSEGGLMSMNTGLGAGEMIDDDLMTDIFNQFSMSIDKMIQSLHSKTSRKEYTYNIGDCVTSYNLNMKYWKKDANKKTDSNFQIKLFKSFSDQTDILIKDLYIVKNMKDCNYTKKFNFRIKGIVTKHVYTIEVIDNKLNIFTTLDGQRQLDPQNPLKKSMFTQLTQLNLINIRSSKTILYKKSIKFK